jgi:hypothetical protein
MKRIDKENSEIEITSLDRELLRAALIISDGVIKRHSLEICKIEESYGYQVIFKLTFFKLLETAHRRGFMASDERAQWKTRNHVVRSISQRTYVTDTRSITRNIEGNPQVIIAEINEDASLRNK